MSAKTYVLTENMAPEAPIYQRVNKEQRVRIDKLPTYSPYLKITYQDASGKNKTIRYKQNANSIFQDAQIKDDSIGANEPFTTNERRALVFRNGVLITNDKVAQEYLESYPGFEGFKGLSQDIVGSQFRVYDKAKEIKIQNDDFKKRAKAANKIAELDLKGMQEMILRLFGSFSSPPEDEMDAQNILINYLNDGGDDELNAILKGEEDLTIDEEMTVLLGKLIKDNVISFEENKGQVSKMIDGIWIPVKEISDEYETEERKRLFGEFLLSDAGKPLFDDLKKSNKEKKGKKAATNND